MSLTHEARRALLRKRIWDVDDFADFAELSHWQAKERLKGYDREMGGMLLRKSNGPTNRKYTFHLAQLARAFPALFEDIEGLSLRVEEVETKLEDLFQRQRMITAQVGHTSRELGKLRRRKTAA